MRCIGIVRTMAIFFSSYLSESFGMRCFGIVRTIPTSSSSWSMDHTRRKTSAIQLYLADELHWQCRTEHSILHWSLKLWDVISMWKADLKKERCVLTCFVYRRRLYRYCRGTSKCLQSCWGLEKLVLVSWKCHAVAWHHGLYEIWRQVCQWFGFALRLCSWSRMLAPGKSMQADLHTPRLPYVLIIYSLLVVFVCNALFLFLLLYFHMYKPQTNLVNVCAQLISLRNEHFFWWHLRCAVFSYVQTPGILWKHLCAAHSIGESHAMTTPSTCCVFICTNPNQTSILGSGGNLQLPHAKKEINWTFL